LQGASIYYYQSKQTSSNGIEKYPKLRLKGFSDPFVIRKIGSFAKCYAGATPSTKNKSFWENGNIPWLSSGEVNKKRINFTDTHITQKGFDNCSTKMVPPGTVVIALAGQGKTRGTVAITNIELCTNQSLASIVTDDTVYDLCLLYYLETQYENLRAISSGDGTRGGLNLQIINDYPVCLPTVDEQIRIAELFMIFDRKIEKQRALVESLKKYKRGVMCSYFSGKFVLHRSNGQHYSPWREYTLSDVSDEFKSGKSITSTDINEVGEYAVYGGNGVRGYTDHYSHDGQYVVVGRQGALCGNVRIIDGKNYLSEHAIAVKANSNHYTPFLLYLLSDMRLGQYSDQGAQPGLAVNKLLKLKRKFPEYEEQVRFATFMQQIDNKLNSENNKLEYITTLKRGLLQQLFI